MHYPTTELHEITREANLEDSPIPSLHNNAHTSVPGYKRKWQLLAINHKYMQQKCVCQRIVYQT